MGKSFAAVALSRAKKTGPDAFRGAFPEERDGMMYLPNDQEMASIAMQRIHPMPSEGSSDIRPGNRKPS